MLGLIIVAGGKSTRMGEDKLLIEHKGKTVLEVVVEKFLRFSDFKKLVVVCDENKRNILDIKDSRVCFAMPGKTRIESVLSGVSLFNDKDFVLVHDAARVFIDDDTIKKSIETAKENKAFFIGVKVTDSIKVKENRKYKSLNRENYIYVQTPQGGLAGDIEKAYNYCIANNIKVNDESSAFEEIGLDMIFLEGKYNNIKLTSPSDRRFL